MAKFCLMILALVIAPTLGLAQNYPAQPIRMVMPYPPGGAGDVVARNLGQRMSESMGQPVVVDNRSGGTAVIGSEFVARAAPDGYTLLLAFDPPHTTTPYFLHKVPFDAVKDFTPITMVVKVPQVLVVNSAVSAKSLKEFIQFARENPGKVFVSTTGKGSWQHFAFELLNQVEKIKLVPVPYKGVPQALTDLLSGQIQAVITTVISAKPYVQSGKLRALAVMDSSRDRAAPDLPTFAEAGVPSYTMPYLVIGLFGPAGMPQPIVSRLYAEVVKAASAPEVRARFENLDFEFIINGPDEMARTIAQSIQIYQKIATEAGIHPE
jgi:tripartite-type tricarboxylate transporter receptor subunit TctC